MKTQLATFILLAITAVSCNSTKQTIKEEVSDTAKEAITDTKWVLTVLEGATVGATENGKELHFVLNSKDNTINGFFGCNIVNGSYTLEAGNRIRFENLITTRMACPDAEVNEAEVLNVLGMVDNYTLNGDTIMLNVGRRAPLAVFTKKATPTNGITEKYWKLKTLEGKEVVMGENQEKEVFFRLNGAENSVAGFAGCNSFGGTFTLEEGNRIRFSNFITTMMACPDVDFNESEFLQIFELADNYTIQGDTLMLNVGRRAPLAVFEAIYME
ncbi:META domain-containing protein [Arenibacter sp. 6A1]|uniref:META domain-containing protein n=1 Tax=Arenibacter sp. 6A1 TaxID=2720391 RepID=UPI001446EA07|nr:META domain-containing protein [Arenibacter sp. 6A1]NKI26646.1 META domain-containing protein [Arenibacter sp. 6A1]